MTEALLLVQSWRPDVLVSDLGLGGEDGVELIRRVRALPVSLGGLVPAIALTGRTAMEDARAALLAGFQVHVAKPIDSWLLTHAVANVADTHG
jgi:CheY-like chemotaxis protein